MSSSNSHDLKIVKNMAKNQPPILAWAKVPGKTYQSLLSPDWASLGPRHLHDKDFGLNRAFHSEGSTAILPFESSSMKSPTSDRPMAAYPGLKPPVYPSAFALRIRPYLEKVLGPLDEKNRDNVLTTITQIFEEQPLLGLATYWLSEVPKAEFGKAEHMDEWISLLCELIDQYAAVTNRKQTKGVSWRADCLNGMLDKLKRMPGKIWDGREEWNKLTDSLIAEAWPRTNNPITRSYYRKGNADLESFQKLATFIRTGENIWEENYAFPLSLIKDLDRDVLRKLLGGELQDQKAAEKKGNKDKNVSAGVDCDSEEKKNVALFAIRMDLIRQHQQYSKQTRKHEPAWSSLRHLVRSLGDFELAKRADEALLPFQPLERSLVAYLKDLKRSKKSRQRRPNAKPRRAS
jgi:hypothetical protein